MTPPAAYTYLRLSVTDQCNLNCFYCQPSERRDFLSPEAFLTRPEIIRLVGFFCQPRVRHVRITAANRWCGRTFASS